MSLTQIQKQLKQIEDYERLLLEAKLLLGCANFSNEDDFNQAMSLRVKITSTLFVRDDQADLEKSEQS